MLEVKKLYREYKPKKGAPVVALNEVSVKFPDKGLIFILGKSGSGKSTLLNVMGGLDKSDGGEIIIKGKSSKDFRQSDFDSYRNTYLGFIFQEYNILDEFNVGQNIALALELQGRKATSEEINKILEEVDLIGYATRKTNELSGGQKQRVAIARALVKNPEIIFADEPTGALDSKTGKAVFDTLKKLSKDKLVVVVSHDREFAELYGDRVIELADGSIISDIEKIKVEGNVKSKGVTIVDDKVIKINEGYVLTADDMEIIREYLNKSKDERLISLDGKVNENVRHVARIDELGNKESFKNTDEANIKNASGVFNSIHSKLSLKHCFRIGAASLKVKPFRLLITIILSIVAFGMFGISDTMGSYEKTTATLRSIKDANYDSLALTKEEVNSNGDYKFSSVVNSNEDDIKIIKEKYGIDMKGVYSLSTNLWDSQANIYNFQNSGYNYLGYYSVSTPGLYAASQADVLSKGFNIIAGEYPTNKNEIAITKHMYESFAQFGYQDYRTLTHITISEMTESKIIGNYLDFDYKGVNYRYKITGIIDTNFNKTAYQGLKSANSISNPDMSQYMLSNTYKAECQYGYHALLYTVDETIEELTKNTKLSVNGNIKMYCENSEYSTSYVSKLTSASNIILPEGKTKLNNNETLIDTNVIRNMMSGDKQNDLMQISITPTVVTFGETTYEVNNLYEYLRLTSIDNYVMYYANETYDEAINNGMNLAEIYYIINNSYPNEAELLDGLAIYQNYVWGSLYNQDYVCYADITLYDYYTSMANKYLAPRLAEILSAFPKLTVSIDYRKGINSSDTIILYTDKEFTCAGIHLLSGNSYNNEFYFDDDTVDLITDNYGSYSYLLGEMPTNDALLNTIIKDNYDLSGDDGTFTYTLKNGVMPSFDSINSTIESLAQVFLYVGIGFAVFASLMLFNFISISISYKKREIGILRAVGARSKDVFHIFFAESFIISLISYVFSTIVTFVVSTIINSVMRSQFSLGITILSPGIRQIALILAVCIGVALISTILPVYKIAMKRPIDAIKER